MLAELKDKSQVTIPKSVINELGLARGDMFDVVVSDGTSCSFPSSCTRRRRPRGSRLWPRAAPRVGRRGRGGRLRRR